MFDGISESRCSAHHAQLVGNLVNSGLRAPTIDFVQTGKAGQYSAILFALGEAITDRITVAVNENYRSFQQVTQTKGMSDGSVHPLHFAGQRVHSHFADCHGGQCVQVQIQYDPRAYRYPHGH